MKTLSHQKVKARRDGGSIVTSFYTDGSYVKRLFNAAGHYVTVTEVKAVAATVQGSNPKTASTRGSRWILPRRTR